MFQDTIQNYTLIDASIEIFTIVMWAFILGMMLGWLLKSDKKCKKISLDGSYTLKKNTVKEDNLQIIEWIGPKIEKLLKKNSVSTFDDILKLGVVWLEEILLKAGKKYTTHSPTTWPDQAQLAMKWKWSELEEYQSILNSSKKKKK